MWSSNWSATQRTNVGLMEVTQGRTACVWRSTGGECDFAGSDRPRMRLSSPNRFKSPRELVSIYRIVKTCLGNHCVVETHCPSKIGEDPLCVGWHGWEDLYNGGPR